MYRKSFDAEFLYENKRCFGASHVIFEWNKFVCAGFAYTVYVNASELEGCLHFFKTRYAEYVMYYQ